jgi:hypothetical protein
MYYYSSTTPKIYYFFSKLWKFLTFQAFFGSPSTTIPDPDPHNLTCRSDPHPQHWSYQISERGPQGRCCTCAPYSLAGSCTDPRRGHRPDPGSPALSTGTPRTPPPARPTHPAHTDLNNKQNMKKSTSLKV